MSADFYLDNFYNETVLKYHSGETGFVLDVNSEQTVGVAARFTPDELATKVGDIIGSVSFYAPTSSDSCSITLKVWQDGSFDNPPGEQVYEKNIQGFDANTWVDNFLSYPVEILSDTEYWIGYIIHTLNGKVCWLDDSTIVEDKGLWLRPSDNWIYPGANPDMANNLMIQMSTFSDNAVENPEVPEEEIANSFCSPNPFSSQTTISYNLQPENHLQQVEVQIFNIKGQLVNSLTGDVQQNSGSIEWNGKNSTGNSLSSGIYLYRLWNPIKSNFLNPTGKILLMR